MKDWADMIEAAPILTYQFIMEWVIFSKYCRLFQISFDRAIPFIYRLLNVFILGRHVATSLCSYDILRRYGLLSERLSHNISKRNINGHKDIGNNKNYIF